MPASRHRWASTSPTARQAATDRVEHSSRFNAHSFVEQDSTGTIESLENTSAVMWCCVRLNTSLRMERHKFNIHVQCTTMFLEGVIRMLFIVNVFLFLLTTSNNWNAYKPMIILSRGPHCSPTSILHCKGHLFQVSWVSVDKCFIDGFIITNHWFWLRCRLTVFPSWWKETHH